MKRAVFAAALIVTGCSVFSSKDEPPFYERAYALPVEAREWAKTAPLKDLCQATKNWRPEAIRDAALDEIYARNIDTRACYYTGMSLTP